MNDLAVSVIERLLSHLDDLYNETHQWQADGQTLSVNWLEHACFRKDHELYDDIYAACKQLRSST